MPAIRSLPLRLRALALLAACGAAQASEPAVGDGFESTDWKAELAQIMADPDWIGPPVEAPFWSLDGASIVFSLKQAGSAERRFWRVDPRAATAAVQVADADYAALDAPDPVFSGDATHAAFIRNGDVFLRALATGSLHQLTRTPAAEDAPSFAADGQSLVWRQGLQWYRHELASGLSAPLAVIKPGEDPATKKPEPYTEHQLRLSSTLARERAQRDALRAREQALRAVDASRAPAEIFLGEDLEIDEVVVAPDARHALVVTRPKGSESGRVGKMPKYVTESGYEEVEDVRTRVGLTAPAGQALRLVNLADGKVTALKLDALPGIDKDPLAELRRAAGQKALEGPRPLRVMQIVWHADGSEAALYLRSVDNKDRWIVRVEAATASLHNEDHLHDPAWINWGSSDNRTYDAFGWVPGSRDLWFMSEASGFVHLYLKESGAKRARALTSGPWEATRVRWSRDGQRAWLQCNRAWPGDYELCEVDRAGKLREITALDGVEDFVPAPDETVLAVLHSSHHTPPQLAVLELGSGTLRTLTDTRTEAYKARAVLAPQYVQVPSKHGAGTVWGKFYRPAELQPGKRYPIALFVHGAGYLQNVSTRYPPYFREQMFHQLLVEHGYLVLDLDYRGSEGYGRDWRTAIYRQMGHPELEDYLDGIDWLVGEQQGDRERVGIYGGSYGGFMTFMAMFRAPEAFHAGAALRPVTDWQSYNHGYTANILNTPDIDPEAYRKSSPIEYAEHLRGALLIAHGMIDDNVMYQDSVRLAQRLIELRKDNWELASYPLERHGYVHPESWYDQYRRIFELFERTLSQ